METSRSREEYVVIKHKEDKEKSPYMENKYLIQMRSLLIPTSFIIIDYEHFKAEEVKYEQIVQSKKGNSEELKKNLMNLAIAKSKRERLEEQIQKGYELKLFDIQPNKLAKLIYSFNLEIMAKFLDQERGKDGKLIFNNRACPFVLEEDTGFILAKLVDFQIYLSNAITHLLLDNFTEKSLDYNQEDSVKYYKEILKYPFQFNILPFKREMNTNFKLTKSLDVLIRASHLLLDQYKDFNGFASIACALTHPSIMRLYNSCNNLPPNLMKIVKEYEVLVSPTNNYQAYFGQSFESYSKSRHSNNIKHNVISSIPWLLPYTIRIDSIIEGFSLKSPFIENNKFYTLFTMAGQTRLEELLNSLPKNMIQLPKDKEIDPVLSHWLLTLPYLTNEQLLEISFKMCNTIKSDNKNKLHIYPNYLKLPYQLINEQNELKANPNKSEDEAGDKLDQYKKEFNKFNKHIQKDKSTEDQHEPFDFELPEIPKDVEFEKEEEYKKHKNVNIKNFDSSIMEDILLDLDNCDSELEELESEYFRENPDEIESLKSKSIDSYSIFSPTSVMHASSRAFATDFSNVEHTSGNNGNENSLDTKCNKEYTVLKHDANAQDSDNVSLNKEDGIKGDIEAKVNNLVNTINEDIDLLNKNAFIPDAADREFVEMISKTLDDFEKKTIVNNENKDVSTNEEAINKLNLTLDEADQKTADSISKSLMPLEEQIGIEMGDSYNGLIETQNNDSEEEVEQVLKEIKDEIKLELNEDDKSFPSSHDLWVEENQESSSNRDYDTNALNDTRAKDLLRPNKSYDDNQYSLSEININGPKHKDRKYEYSIVDTIVDEQSLLKYNVIKVLNVPFNNHKLNDKIEDDEFIYSKKGIDNGIVKAQNIDFK